MSEEILEDLDEEEADEAEEKLELDYQLGEDFKDKIIPRAVDYFTGKALEYDMLDDDEDDYEDIDDEEDEDNDHNVRPKNSRLLTANIIWIIRTPMGMKSPLVDEGLPKDAAVIM